MTTKLHLLPWLVSLLAAACAGPQEEAPRVAHGVSTARSDATGGDLSVEDLPPQTVQVLGDRIVVWGTTEVPSSSRLQAALAMVDAVTRAELTKYVQARVASLSLDRLVVAGGGERQEIVVRTVETARASLGSIPVQRGWAYEGEVLRLVGRLELDRAHLQSWVKQPALNEEGQQELLEALLAGKPALSDTR